MTHSRITKLETSLETITIFAGLPANVLGRIESQCSFKHYKPGESIIDYMDTSDDVFFLVEGQARVTIYSLAGKAVSFRDLSPGELFGEYPAVDQRPRSASVETLTGCFVAAMSASNFRALLHSEPTVALSLLQQLVETIRRLTERVYEFSTLAVNNRIQAELLRLAGLVSRQGKSVRIDPAPTHTEIANRVSTHREAVTRELSRLVRGGVLERKERALVIKDVDRLAQMVHEATGE